ncbi:DUF551 domain-containing protein [Pseudomonas nitroreducens]|uniref:DUF551 domain-containing protein n=1 Tax=Pseudomonas nitroreducens TaxID=46680 RepID=UPI00036FAE87|nr:DUF551 domain-containing protein [Pseudomonas nitroreducens]
MSEWIKCSDRLPEYQEDVIVLMPGGYIAAAYVSWLHSNGNADWAPANVHSTYDGIGRVVLDDVPTHWMPSPELPTEES